MPNFHYEFFSNATRRHDMLEVGNISNVNLVLNQIISTYEIYKTVVAYH